MFAPGGYRPARDRPGYEPGERTPMNNDRPKAPYRLNTRQRFQRVGGGSLAMGERLQVELPRVGFLAGVLVTVEGGVTLSGGAMSNLGPYNLLQRIQLEANVGAAMIYDTSGYGNLLVQSQSARAFRGDSDSAGVATDGAVELSQFVTGAGGVKLHYFIPVAVNDGAQFSVGQINLQAPEVRVTVNMQVANAIADVHSGATDPVLTYQVSYLYYEVPSPREVKWPPLILHRTLEDTTPITQTGDVVYTVPRQGTLLSLAHVVALNGARNTADVVDLRLRINKTDDVYRVPAVQHAWWYAQRYSRLPRVGQFLWDFFHADDDPNRGDMRDAIDSESISTLESIVGVASGATLGSGNNFLRTIRRIVQPLQL
jgi:hypothetical protein